MNLPTLFSPSQHTDLIPHLVSLHARCITEPTHTIATFLPPLDIPLMTSWWESRVAEIEKGERLIFIQTVKDEKEEEKVVGVVSLAMPFGQTGPFRSTVEKLLVLPEWRGSGVAKSLMNLLESEAKARNRGLLMLDTEKGSPAELVYPRLGWIKVGEIPRYEMSPLDGSLKDAVFFYKDLR